MNKLAIITVSAIVPFLSVSLSCDDRVASPAAYHIERITASPDTIYADNNETSSIIEVLVRDGDNFSVANEPVSFKTNIGNIVSDATTDSAGVATSTFWDNNQMGLATIEAFVAKTSATVEVAIVELPPVPPDEVNFIGFDYAGQIEIQVQGTGGQESYDLVVNLYDMQSQLIEETKTVWFELLNYPEGTNINNVGVADSTLSAGGKATVSINSGHASGPVTVKACTFNSQQVEISAIKSNIVVHAGPPNSINFSMGGNDSGVDMGGGIWRIEIGALLTDSYGNPVNYGTAVFFSLPDDPDFASVNADAYVGNVNAAGDSLDGTAFTYLSYEGTHTNDRIVLKVETGDFSDSDSLVLPIQFPFIDISASPQHIDWNDSLPDPPPDDQTTTIGIMVKDGQNNPVDNQTVIFSSTLGDPLDMGTDDDANPFTEMTGVTGGEHGRIDKEIEFHKYECPAPFGGTPGTTTATVTAQILGAQVSNNVTVILIRY